MPSAGDGTGWDENLPIDHSLVSDGPLEIRDLRKGVRARCQKEHVLFDSDSNYEGGEHRLGSAKVYVQNTAPTKRPDGNSSSVASTEPATFPGGGSLPDPSGGSGTALDTDDKGRLWISSAAQLLGVTGVLLQYWSGSAWVDLFAKPYIQMAIVGDVKTSGTNGQALSTTGAWTSQRDLNTELYDPDAIVSVTGNKFILNAGTYRLRAKSVFYKTNASAIRFYNSTDAVVLSGSYPGLSVSGNTSVQNSAVSETVAVVALSGTKTIAVQYFIQTANASNGGGYPTSNGVNEVYTIVEIEKLR